jgi:hypothetical protein
MATTIKLQRTVTLTRTETLTIDSDEVTPEKYADIVQAQTLAEYGVGDVDTALDQIEELMWESRFEKRVEYVTTDVPEQGRINIEINHQQEAAS